MHPRLFKLDYSNQRKDTGYISPKKKRNTDLNVLLIEK